MNVRTGRPQASSAPRLAAASWATHAALGECRARYLLGEKDISNESQKVAVGVDGRGLLAIPALLVHQQRCGFWEQPQAEEPPLHLKRKNATSMTPWRWNGTECVTDRILGNAATYHFGFEPRRPRVAGYNQQPTRKGIKDSVQLSVHTDLITTTICVFLPTDRITNQKATAKFILDLKSAWHLISHQAHIN